MADPAPAPAPAPDPAPAPAPVAWHTGLDAEILGHAQNKAWKLDDPKAAFTEAVKAARAAQQFVGAPPEQLLRLPKDQTDEAGWKAIYGRLGVPEAAKDYDFSGVKFADGTAVDDAFAEAIRPALLNARVPKDRAAEVVQAVVKFMDGAEAEESAAQTAKLTEEKATLAKNWGKNEAANKFIASQAAEKLGLKPDAVAALEGVIGYAAIMEMFHKIGRSLGEDKYVSGEQPGGGIMSKEMAQARKGELMGDKAWVARHNSGDAAARREMRALNVIITGDDGSTYAA